MAKTTKKKMTKKAQVQAFRAKNPNATIGEIAKETGAGPGYVSSILSNKTATTGQASCGTTTSRGTTSTVSRQYATGAATTGSGVCSTETATVLSARAQMTQIVASVGPVSAQRILDCVSQPCGG